MERNNKYVVKRYVNCSQYDLYMICKPNCNYYCIVFFILVLIAIFAFNN